MSTCSFLSMSFRPRLRCKFIPISYCFPIVQGTSLSSAARPLNRPGRRYLPSIPTCCLRDSLINPDPMVTGCIPGRKIRRRPCVHRHRVHFRLCARSIALRMNGPAKSKFSVTSTRFLHLRFSDEPAIRRSLLKASTPSIHTTSVVSIFHSKSVCDVDLSQWGGVGFCVEFTHISPGQIR